MRLTPLAFFLLACPTAEDTGKDGDTADTSDTADSGEPAPDLVSDCSTTACGGDPSGAWAIADSCAPDVEMALDWCAEGYMKVTAFSNTGTLTVNADGSYTTAFEGGDVTLEIFAATSCLGGATCAQLQEQAEQNIPGVVCVDSTGGCTCTATTQTEADSDAGTWTTAGSVLTFNSTDDGNSQNADFCVDSDEMWLQMREGESDMPLGFVLSKVE